MLKWIFIFLFGGIVGATYDGFHTHSGTDGYYDVWQFQMAWWVPLLFGVAVSAICLNRLVFDRIFNIEPEVKSWKEVWAGIGFLTLQYFVSGYMKVDPLTRFLFQAAFAFCIWWIFDGTALTMLYAVLVASVGTFVEIQLVHFGKFFYVISDIGPNLFGVPFWLPFLYISGTVAAGNLARKIF